VTANASRACFGSGSLVIAMRSICDLPGKITTWGGEI